MSESERMPGNRNRSQVTPIASRDSRIANVFPGRRSRSRQEEPKPERQAPTKRTSTCSRDISCICTPSDAGDQRNRRCLDNGAMDATVGARILREELALPLCTLRDGALRANSRALPAFLHALGARCGAAVELSPHGKTSMIKELWRRQLDDGCWAITTANAQQARVA